MEMTEIVREVRKMRYTTQAPDGTQITADMTDTSTTITYGGTSVVIPLDTIAAMTALTATMSAAIIPIQPVETTPVEEQPV